MAKNTAVDIPVGKKGRNPAGSGSRSKVTKAAKGAKKPDRLSLVRSLIEKWSTKIEADVSKAGVTELIRLLSLEKELSETTETVREIKVTWVEPTETESSTSE